MFPNSYFPPNYFPPSYFPRLGGSKKTGRSKSYSQRIAAAYAVYAESLNEQERQCSLARAADVRKREETLFAETQRFEIERQRLLWQTTTVLMAEV